MFDDTIEVPGDIFTDVDLFKNMFNMDTWNTGLTDLTKQKLMVGNSWFLDSYHTPREFLKKI